MADKENQNILQGVAEVGQLSNSQIVAKLHNDRNVIRQNPLVGLPLQAYGRDAVAVTRGSGDHGGFALRTTRL